MYPFDKRLKQHDTNAFVVPSTVEGLADKMLDIIGRRRMTLMRRYLGEAGGQPRITSGLRFETGGISGPISRRGRESVHVRLTNDARSWEGFGFGIHLDDETEESVAQRYHHPEDQWLGQRRNIMFVRLDGWPGSPRRDDRIEVERWNEHGVGEQVIVTFDDIDLVRELARQIKGDPDENRALWDESFCEAHGLHSEHPKHTRGGCRHRAATLAEDLEALAELARQREQAQG